MGKNKNKAIEGDLIYNKYLKESKEDKDFIDIVKSIGSGQLWTKIFSK